MILYPAFGAKILLWKYLRIVTWMSARFGEVSLLSVPVKGLSSVMYNRIKDEAHRHTVWCWRNFRDSKRIEAPETVFLSCDIQINNVHLDFHGFQENFRLCPLWIYVEDSGAIRNTEEYNQCHEEYVWWLWFRDILSSLVWTADLGKVILYHLHSSTLYWTLSWGKISSLGIV